MASKDPSKLSSDERGELCCSYAALMLHDDGLEISAEKLAMVIRKSGNEVEPYWPLLFSKALQGASVDKLLTEVISAAPAGAAAAGGGAAAAVEEDKKEEKKEEVEDVDMGGLFGGDDDDY